MMKSDGLAISNAEIVDELVAEFRRAVVFFVSPKANSSVQFESVGSGFIALYRESIFLVTAHHVITSINERSSRIALIANKAVDISKLPFIADEGADIAVAHLDGRWAIKSGLIDESRRTVPTIKLEPVLDKYRSLNTYFFMGYPTSKNEFRKYDHGRSHYLQAYSLTELNRLDDRKISLKFDIGNMTTTEGKSANPPHLKGISGGPILEVFQHTSANVQPMFRVKLVGSIASWNKKSKEIAGATTGAILSCVNS